MFNDQNSQTHEFIRRNIIKVIDEKGNFYGSGFFINVNDKKYGVTCHHCIYKLNKIMVEKNYNKYLMKWNEKYSDMNKDIAVLELDNDCTVESLNYNLQAMPELPVNVWGFSAKSLDKFPAGMPGQKGNLSGESFPFSWKEENIQGKKTYQNKWNQKPKINVNIFGYNGKFELGFSGAPVCYEGDNKVVGMFVAKDESNGYVLPIQTLLDKFSSNILGSTTGNQDNSFYLEKGNKHHHKREFDETLIFYNEIKDSNYLSASSNKDRLNVQLDKTKEAIDLFSLVYSIDPNFIFALIGMGISLYNLGKYDEAITWYDKALVIIPDYAFVSNNTVMPFDLVGKAETAIKGFGKAFAIRSHYALVLNNKGIALDKLGKYEELKNAMIKPWR